MSARCLQVVQRKTVYRHQAGSLSSPRSPTKRSNPYFYKRIMLILKQKMKRNEGLKFRRQACRIFLRGLRLGSYYFPRKTAPSQKLPRGHKIMEPFPNVLRVDIDMTLGTTLYHQARMLTAFLFYFGFFLSLGIHCSKKRKKKKKTPPCLAMQDKSTHPVMTRSR